MRVLIAIVFTLALMLPSFSEEVVLDIDDNTPFAAEVEAAAKTADMSGLTLYEKIKNIKAKEIKDTTNSRFLLEDITTKHFEKGFIETVHPFFATRMSYDIDIDSDDTTSAFGFSMLDAGIDGKLREGKGYYEARMRFNPQHEHSFFQFLPSNVYVASTAIPHHVVILGNTRTPAGVEGGMGHPILPFNSRAQIARNLGNIRKIGVRVKGEYDLIDYDFGLYDSSRYFSKFFSGGEFSGWANFKPLGKTDGKFGVLKIGSGITTGHKDITYFQTGAYVGYEYKKFSADFEWGKANGYNGAKEITKNHAEGFYTTVGYKITPKVQLLARYDQFKPNKQYSGSTKREYSAGINYFIKGQALRLILNYVFCQNDQAKNSHRIVIGTQIML